MSTISSVGLSTATQHAEKLRQRPHASLSGKDFSEAIKPGFESAARTAGVREAKIPGLLEDVRQAVAKATANALGSKNPRASIQAAVDGVLKENGVDVARFQAAMEAQRGQDKASPGSGGPGGAHGHHGGHRPEKAEPSDSAGGTQITELKKLIDPPVSVVTDKDKQFKLALADQQSVGNGGIVDIAV